MKELDVYGQTYYAAIYDSLTSLAELHSRYVRSSIMCAKYGDSEASEIFRIKANCTEECAHSIARSSGLEWDRMRWLLLKPGEMRICLQ